MSSIGRPPARFNGDQIGYSILGYSIIIIIIAALADIDDADQILAAFGGAVGVVERGPLTRSPARLYPLT